MVTAVVTAGAPVGGDARLRMPRACPLLGAVSRFPLSESHPSRIARQSGLINRARLDDCA